MATYKAVMRPACCTVVVYPLPCLWGESDHPVFGPPDRLSLRMASSSITPAGRIHKSRGDNVVCMWVQLKRSCVLQSGHSSDGCVLASTFCKYDLRK